MSRTDNTQSGSTDEELVAAVRTHADAACFAVLYDRYAAKVFSKCYGLTGDRDRAKDLTHDIFLKAFLNMGTFDGRASFGTWLYRITFNYCMDHLRGKKRQPEVMETDKAVDVVDDDAQEHALLQLRADRLEQVLQGLDVPDRALLLFKYQDEMSIKDMMELLEMTESAVKMRLHRARSRALARYHQLYPEEQ